MNPCHLAGSTLVSSIEHIYIQGDITHLFHSIVDQTWHTTVTYQQVIQMLTKAESETGDGSGSLPTFQIRPVSRSKQPL